MIPAGADGDPDRERIPCTPLYLVKIRRDANSGAVKKKPLAVFLMRVEITSTSPEIYQE